MRFHIKYILQIDWDWSTSEVNGCKMDNRGWVTGTLSPSPCLGQLCYAPSIFQNGSFHELKAPAAKSWPFTDSQCWSRTCREFYLQALVAETHLSYGCIRKCNWGIQTQPVYRTHLGSDNDYLISPQKEISYEGCRAPVALMQYQLVKEQWTIERSFWTETNN
jgi:hypothetical protein